MSTLFLLTKKFPYGHQEAYLFAELEVLKRVFEKIVIIPHDEFDYNSKESRIVEDEQIAVFKVNKNLGRLGVFSKLKARKKAARWFKVDLHKRISPGEVRANKNQYLIQMTHAFAQANALRDYLLRNHQELSQITLYNYWLHRGVLLSGQLKELLPEKNIKIVSRAHSYDIYHDHWFEMFAGANPKFLPFLYYKLEMCDKIYTISTHGYKFIRDKYTVPEEKLDVARLGVTDYAKSIETLRKKDDQFIFVTCSWITELKRVYLMPEIISKMGLNIKWVHFGSGDEVSLSKLNNAIDQNNVEDSCLLKGKVDHMEIIEFYKENYVDLFLNLSTVEGIPVALMEAACFSIPMVATNTVGNPEIVNDKNGFLIPVEFDSDEIASELKKLFNDPISVEQKRSSARKTFLELYNADKNYMNFANKLKS